MVGVTIDQPFVLEWWPIISFVTIALATVIGTLGRREIKQWRREIADDVRAATAQIQPSKNGGKSLADANRKLDELAALPGLMQSVLSSVDDLRDRTGNLEKAMTDHLRDHAQRPGQAPSNAA